MDFPTFSIDILIASLARVEHEFGMPVSDRSLELKHAGDITSVIVKTLDFSLLLEFLVATPCTADYRAHRNHQRTGAD
jgi:hypothetical protein